MKRIFSSLTGLALIIPAAAPAQDMGWSTITPSITGTDVLGLRLREQMQRQRPTPRNERTTASPNAFVGSPSVSAPAADIRALRYTPSKSRRAANLTQFVNKTRAIDPRNAEDLQRLFAQGDFIERLGTLIAPFGLRTDNVADAYTVWMITAWNATQGRNDTPSRNMTQAVRAQMISALSAAPEIIDASEAAKQELAEALLVQMALVDTAVEQNKAKPTMLRQFGAAVNQGAKRMGIDLTTMRLTEQGFVPATTGQNGAPDMPGGGDAVASAGDGGTGRYTPIALAALGGVGGLIWWRRGRG